MATISRRILLRNSVLAAGGIAASGFLAACSSDDESDAPSAANGKWTLQSAWVNDAEFMGYFVAVQNGYYKEEGLDFTYVPGGASVIPETVLQGGRANIALSTPDNTANAILKQGAPFVIVGTQYQKSPLGVVSLTESGISSPADLVGKKFAVPDGNRLTVDKMFQLNDIDPGDVNIVPYAYDPTGLIAGDVDATLDFTTNVPYTVEQAGAKASSFLLYDFGMKLPNDVVIVSKDTLEKDRDSVVSWLRASRRGWEENFKDPAQYPPTFEDSWFKGTGRTVDNEIFFNTAQQALIEAPDGIFSMTDETVANTIATLNSVDIAATEDMFDTSLLAEI
jgi:ABC-type nitrate/sulfonate/bicarbonate transport system substrate-binding protein